MTREEKLKLIETVIQQYKECEEVLNDLGKYIGCDPDSLLFKAVYGTLETLIKSTASQIGDDCVLLGWFIYDNGCGKLAHLGGYYGNVRPIRTPEDLVDLIEAEL